MPTLADIQRQKSAYEEKFEPNHNTPWGVIVEVDGSISPPNRPNMTWVDMYNRSLRGATGTKPNFTPANGIQF